ncbi:MAG: M28 family peptidase, partial [Anaerolineae bacterium]|nr:M28 family peptidase [Anaerolineae bacterium]
MNTQVRNILAWKGQGPALLLGAHYDTRRSADQEDPSHMVMGANDGASGVAVLLELARVLNIDKTGNLVYLAFFDAEDNGRIDGWDGIVGSRYMVAHWGEREEEPLQQAVIIDMIGDTDLSVYMEKNSDPVLMQEIWQTAGALGYGSYIIPQYKYAIIDDHIPFMDAGVAAVVIIDFDYPYWHTTQDTPDKVSVDSLHIIGSTLQSW